MITLLIPTINRSDFLIRQLNYYREAGFNGCICIGDSSHEPHLEPTRRAVKALQGSLNIIYKEYPNLNDAECLRQLLDFVPTPYAAFVADDDFIVPASLEPCTRFLDNNADYAAVHGLALTISLKSRGAYGRVAGARPYPLPLIEGESATERILQHLGNYSVTLFAVHRLESWREMYRDISRLRDKSFASELLPCCLSVIKGKVKQLDGLYLVRHDHDQRYFLPRAYDWVRNPEWPSLYRVFSDLLAGELARQDGISPQAARETVERGFDAHVTGLLGPGWQSYCGRGTAGARRRLMAMARRIPGASPVWRAILSLRPKPQPEIPVATLLDPAYPYHADFLPVYRAMTAELST